MSEEKKTRTIELLYKGRAVCTGGKLGYRFAMPDKPDEDMYWTFKKSPQVYGVGVYQVEQPLEQPEGGMTIHGGTFRWSRRWEDEAAAAHWEAESEAAKSITQAKTLAKNRATELEQLCAPLGRIFRNLSPFQKEAFILYVVREIRRPHSWKDEE